MNETTHIQSSCPGEAQSADIPGIHVDQHAMPPDVDGRDKPGHDERSLWRFLRMLLFVCFCVTLLAGSSLAAFVVWLGPAPLPKASDVSASVLDRNGRLLRAYAMEDGRWRLPATVKDVDPVYLDLLLAAEDRRFYSHHGVDPLALMRAAWQFASTGHIISGGSTITMQVARLIEPGRDVSGRDRSLGVKLRQIVRAFQIEHALDKDAILNLYLTLAPFGGNLEGVRAASLAYFGKEPRRLSLSEAALLVSLPQSPETRRLDRFPDAARAARDRVLTRLVAAGRIEPEDAASARREAVPQARLTMPMLAPHMADQTHVASADPVTRLTLDAVMQANIEALARDRAAGFGPDVSIGILVVDNASGDVLAHVGSPDYFDTKRAGQVDMTRALRSPGSTLKPFIYGLAFEDGFVHPESMIDDKPVRFGNYAPQNFDMTFQGTVTVRHALQMSLNVPAVELLDRVGASRLAARLNQAGANLVLPKNETPGLAMGLGGIGITLSDLVRLYVGLARLGETVPLREIMSPDASEGENKPLADRRRLMDNVAAWQVGNVLIGTPPPENAPRNRIAFKTGTSYGYRDAWAVGFDGRMTIGVWVGRPDGMPVPGLAGRVSAAPILFDAFARTGKTPVALPRAPRGTLITTSAQLPVPLRRFRPVGELIRDNEAPTPHIRFPLDGSRLDLSNNSDCAGNPTSLSPMSLKVSGGMPPLTVMVNGMPVGQLDARRQRMVDAPGPGFVRLTVMDKTGAADTVVVRVQ